MDDTIALVVKISKSQYEICKQSPLTECAFAIAVGVPLDKLREEVMEYIDDLDIAYEICGVFGNIGKAERNENIPVKFIPINADCRGYTDTFRCSECGGLIATASVTKELEYDFCPWCGEKAE